MGLYTAKYAYFAAPHDLVSPGLENVWIAEVGSASLNGTFDSFKKTLSDSSVRETYPFRRKDARNWGKCSTFRYLSTSLERMDQSGKDRGRN